MESIDYTDIKKMNQLVDLLLLNGTLVECPGLIHGKMGIVIFFFHYADYTKNDFFEDYALDLITEIKAQIHSNSPADYENGLAGIGVGFDYLLRNNFLQIGEPFYKDLDKRMYRAVMYDPWQDFSLYDGLAGYGQYWLFRMNDSNVSSHTKECLSHFIKLIEENIDGMSEKEQSDVYRLMFELNNNGVKTDRLNSYFVKNPIENNYNAGDLSKKFNVENLDKMGLLNGCAGQGMAYLSRLAPQYKSWIKLL